jgi:hypothetical protein
MKTYTTREACKALGLNSASAVLRVVKVLGIEPVKVDCEYVPAGFVYQFTEDQIQVMKSRRKRGRPKSR